MNLTIEPITVEDLAQIAEAETVCFSDPWSEPMLRESLESDVTETLQLRVEGELAVYLVGYDLPGEGHLLNIATLPKFRRQGLGRHLLAHWLENGRQKGWEVVYLEVREHNISAIRLYEAFGFITLGRRRKYYNDGEDALVMAMVFEKHPSGGDTV